MTTKRRLLTQNQAPGKRKKARECQEKGCMAQPSFNLEGEKRGIFCGRHKRPGMLDVKHKRCHEEGCIAQPSYNLEGEKFGIFCGRHKRPGMLDVLSKQCHEEGCMARPLFNLDGEKLGIFCGQHKKPGMVDVVNKRCKECHITRVAQKGFMCFGCRTGTDRIKQLEEMVKDYLDAHEFFKMWTYRDSVLPCAPQGNRRRPDFVWILDTHLIVLEVDEYAHRDYERDCEASRVTELMEQAGGKPVFLIRFNPQKRLLEEMRRCFATYRTCVVTVDTPLLTVSFIGYRREYDVVEEIERVGLERRLK